MIFCRDGLTVDGAIDKQLAARKLWRAYRYRVQPQTKRCSPETLHGGI
jgi:hypothetical protein